MNYKGIRSLVVFDSLRVCGIKVEPRRIRARYELAPAGGKVVYKELIYSYPDRVFDDSAESVNLASMILSQVAINYGLFSSKIIFDGLFEDADKRFILDMMENTSREIYVNKILFPNEFLKFRHDRIKPEKQKRYTAAKVSFENTLFREHVLAWKHRDTLNDSYMVLSSGGKDSLLSYGILKELDKEVRPVFINESGRHWFTAINGYNYLKQSEPATARVWCNCDRIYNWILRHMPFIRDHFEDIRSDHYPIRLWTVAVFLFGSLPLAHQSKSGNIVIGNEYDTTMKSSWKGITHYNALYDQSKYFDNALTRYYTKKGWNIYQYSLLRSLSEMLILKTLVNRYPGLHNHQVSCHSARVSDNRARPCGKCEKCRRIIAMLTALGESPVKCGYTAEQVQQALECLPEAGVKQLETDSAHLYHMLLVQGIIKKDTPIAGMSQPNPQIMKLRFDNERSALNDMPLELMGKVIPIFLAHADGAVKRQDKKWLDFNVIAELENAGQYPFEVSDADTGPANPGPGYRWELYNWKDIETRLTEIDTAILPCGSIEQHGPHLPLDVDYFDAVYLAGKVAESCSNPKPLVLPGIPYGVSYHHDDFKGTLSISNNTLSSLVHDVGLSLAKNGISKLIILNGHGDNSPALRYAAQLINRDTGIFVCVESGETSDPDLYGMTDTPNDIHAGEIETSTTLAVRPDLVKMDKAVTETMNFGSKYLDFSSERGVPWYVRTKIISESGVMGDPSRASAEKGNKFWKIMIAHLVRFVEEVKRSRMEDLYQRKY
jgi:creatinine amidohydrolase/Fe(II)-dependent formamide hydrolase-like protein